MVDDNRNILVAAEAELKNDFAKVRTATTPNQIWNIVTEEPVDVVLLDMNFLPGHTDGKEGISWLKMIKKKRPDTQVIAMTAHSEVDIAVEALKEGAFDFIPKPWDSAKLVASVKAAYEMRKTKGEVRRLEQVRREAIGVDRSPWRGGKYYWGKTDRMRSLYMTVQKVARTDANILITGENGTGKEMMAREIHRMSNRGEEVFVGVDMGAIPPSLFESELFGNAKGAYTGAIIKRAGKFEMADNGTLFLDEIGNLPPEMQAKLLGVLQSREVTRLGEATPIPIDIRLICATNKNLEDAMAMSEFRQDLLYRINTIHVNIPPLRERVDDIIPLAKIFIEQYAEKYGKGELELTRNSVKKLRKAPWPGNIRELQNTIEKAVIICDGGWIDEAALTTSRAVLPSAPQVSTLEEMEKEMITKAMDIHAGNLVAAAEALGITRQTLYNKLKKMNYGAAGSKA